MKETIFATYERESTLWKNANALYKAQDWTKMECGFQDFSDIRKSNEEIGLRYINRNTGEDITDEITCERFYDRYFIRLTNKRGTNSKSFSFRTREEANDCFKEIFNHKHMHGWKKVI